MEERGIQVESGIGAAKPYVYYAAGMHPRRYSGRRRALAVRLRGEYSRHMDYSKIITIEPGKRSGKPCIRGMRITVSDVLEYLASGMTQEQILNDFPELTREDIRACLAFAADREKRLAAAVR